MQNERIPESSPWSRLFKTLLSCALLICPSAAVLCDDTPGQTGFRIAVFTPTTANNTYWPEVHSILRADAAFFSVEFGEAVQVMDAAELSAIPFCLNGPKRQRRCFPRAKTPQEPSWLADRKVINDGTSWRLIFKSS
ncbi:hypothetical protein [Wenzhouxiangella sp. XN24]|uniref:hypothetical protein n=1 Tax=Wenzhouxiangella sp. XN24 TaxID=2713569 RepID=UPI0013EDF626|nr:hypothetical protein [Wenzhouxiangella sp. XN24]NGX15006.1 hypothetical protein [Wenzhouxiangella sp. XN24]